MCCPHVFVCLYVFLGRRCIDCGCRPAPWKDTGWPAAFRAPTPTPHIQLRILSARPLSAGHPVTSSPVLAGPDGGPGPENPGTGHCCNPQCRLGALAGSWVPGGHSRAAGPPWGLTLWLGVFHALGQCMGQPPAQLPEGRPWERDDLGGGGAEGPASSIRHPRSH